mgnify:CR=1 FL=1
MIFGSVGDVATPYARPGDRCGYVNVAMAAAQKDARLARAAQGFDTKSQNSKLRHPSRVIRWD